MYLAPVNYNKFNKLNNFIKINFYVINLLKNKKRLQNILNKANKAKIEIERIEAVDGKKINLENLLPCVKKNKSSNSYKGLWLSNLKIFKKIKYLRNKPKWFVIFEDDAEIPENFLKIVEQSIQRYPDVKVINFDKRQGYIKEYDYSDCCCSCVMYKTEIVDLLVKHLNPISNFVKNYNNIDNRECLWDFAIFNLLKYLKIKMVCVPIVNSGNFPSTVSP